MAAVTLTIDNDYLDLAIEGLTYLHPVPVDGNGDPTMSESAWLKEWIRALLAREITRGLTRKRDDTQQEIPPFDGNIT